MIIDHLYKFIKSNKIGHSKSNRIGSKTARLAHRFGLDEQANTEGQ